MTESADVMLWGTRIGCVHQMSVNGKKTGIIRADMLAAAKSAGLNERSAGAIIDEVREAVSRWADFAKQAKVRDALARKIGQQLKRGK